MPMVLEIEEVYCGVDEKLHSQNSGGDVKEIVVERRRAKEL